MHRLPDVNGSCCLGLPGMPASGHTQRGVTGYLPGLRQDVHMLVSLLRRRGSVNPTGKWHRLAHAWTQTAGPEVQLSGVNRGDPSFTVPANATDGTTLEFRLTVTDQVGQSDTDTVVVTVDSTPEPTPPTACAGPDLEAQPGEEVTLLGDCSINPHGKRWRMAHLWTQPAGQNISLSDATIAKPTFTMLTDAAPGTTYTFTLTVTDQDGESDSDDMTVTVPGDTGDSQTVDPPPNGAPVFDDGIALTRSIPENSAAGTNVGDAVTATDPDDDTITYSLSGTDAASFGIDSETGQITTIEGVTYDFEAKVSYSLSVDARDSNGGAASIPITVKLTDVDETPPKPEATTVTACFTTMGTLSSAAEYAGTWDDADCKAHHQDGRARYFHFTLSEPKSVSISLSSGALYVSKDTPKNGWGTVPGPGYEHRKSVRRANGKLVHDGGSSATLTLATGTTYTVEVAGSGGTFTLSIAPQ